MEFGFCSSFKLSKHTYTFYVVCICCCCVFYSLISFVLIQLRLHQPTCLFKLKFHFCILIHSILVIVVVWIFSNIHWTWSTDCIGSFNFFNHFFEGKQMSLMRCVIMVGSLGAGTQTTDIDKYCHKHMDREGGVRMSVCICILNMNWNVSTNVSLSMSMSMQASLQPCVLGAIKTIIAKLFRFLLHFVSNYHCNGYHHRKSLLIWYGAVISRMLKFLPQTIWNWLRLFLFVVLSSLFFVFVVDISMIA